MKDKSASTFDKKCESSKVHINVSTEIMCTVCNLIARDIRVPTFIALPATARIEKKRKLILCKIFLHKHDGRYILQFCFKCSKPYNTLLHITVKNDSDNSNGENSSDYDEAAVKCSHRTREYRLRSCIISYCRCKSNRSIHKNARFAFYYIFRQ